MSLVVPRMMTLDEFTPLVGSIFLADCDPTPVGVTLIEASASLKAAHLVPPPFILIFRSAPDAQLIEGDYVLRCGEWGPAVIHLIPTLPPIGGEAGYYYQAIFT